MLKHDLLGYGLIQPLRRASGRDFVAAGGVNLVRSSVEQVLGTKPGELPWRPDFGLDLERYRHRNMPSTATHELSEAAVQHLGAHIVEALTRWEGRVNVSDVSARKVNNVITARVRWGVRKELTGLNVVGQPETTEVTR